MSGSRQLLSKSPTREEKQTNDGRKLNHKSERSQPAVSSLALSDSRFMSNTGAIAGPAVYMESRSDGTNTYIAATIGENYACANLGLKSSTMCNGISNGKECVPFTNTCDSNGFDGDGGGGGGGDEDEIDLSSPSDATIGIEEDGSGAGVANGDGSDEADVVRDGGTAGISDDFGPETGPPPILELEATIPMVISEMEPLQRHRHFLNCQRLCQLLILLMIQRWLLLSFRRQLRRIILQPSQRFDAIWTL